MSCYYTGKEPSPKGLGKCARDAEPGQTEIGRDHRVWIVAKDRLGRLSWKKYSSNIMLAEKLLEAKAHPPKARHVIAQRAESMMEASYAVLLPSTDPFGTGPYEEKYPSRTDVAYFPQEDERVVWARTSSLASPPPASKYQKRKAGGKRRRVTRKKRFLTGQLSYAPKMGIVLYRRGLGRIPKYLTDAEVARNARTLDGTDLLVMGPASDPVLEVVS